LFFKGLSEFSLIQIPSFAYNKMPRGMTFCSVQFLKCITHPVLKDIRFTAAAGPQSKAPIEASPPIYNIAREECSLTR